jgi:hypothetical protein
VEKLVQLWTQHQAAVVVGAVVLLVLVLLVGWAGKRKYGKKIDPKLDADLGQGNYEAAAERELRAGRLRAAYDLFLRAQQPMRAAQIAARLGRLQDAAELFEKASSRKRAADLYKQVGMKQKAEELMAEEERSVRKREEQKAALRKRLAEEPEEGVASLERSSPPAPRTPAPAAPSVPAPMALDLGGVAQPAPAGDLDLGSEAKPAAPSRFGIQALVDEAAQKADSQALALAETQASMASLTDGARELTVSRGEKREGLALQDVDDAAVSEARQGPAVEELSFDEAKPQVREPSFGQAKPEAAQSPPAAATDAEISSGSALPAEELLLVDSRRHATAPPPAAIVENAPEAPPRPARTTPRAPIPVVSGPSIGAYRMVRPSEPDVYTPPPSVRSPSDGHLDGERRPRTPTPAPRLSLGAKRGMGETAPLPPRRTPTPAVNASSLPDCSAPRPATPSPAPRPSPKGTILGLGPARSGK